MGIELRAIGAIMREAEGNAYCCWPNGPTIQEKNVREILLASFSLRRPMPPPQFRAGALERSGGDRAFGSGLDAWQRLSKKRWFAGQSDNDRLRHE